MSESMDVDQDVKRSGRGFSKNEDDLLSSSAGSKLFSRSADETKEDVKSSKALKSIEGWIVLITGVHEEATEEDVQDKFADYGQIKNLHLNLDRRTGYVKGYALVEYATYDEALSAINGASGSTLLDQELECDFAFVKPPTGPDEAAPRAAGRAGGRQRSNSPSRRR